MTRYPNMRSLLLTGCACLGLLCTSSTFAQQNESQNPRSDRQQGERQNQRQGQAELPEFLQKLDLSSEQESQIKQALQQHNQKFRRTWRQFHTKHAEAIELEAAWAAAVRDSLSEEDQRKFDQQRMQDREMSQRSGQDEARSRRDAVQQRSEDRQSRQEDRQRRQEERQRRQEGRSENAQPDAAQRQRNEDGAQTAGNQREDAGSRDAVGLIIITSASPERFLKGTSQSTEQKQQCDKACRQYKQKLTSVWNDLHELHHELVKIEADRISAVEEQLTEEQLAQLKQDRQQPQDTQASATSTLQR